MPTFQDLNALSPQDFAALTQDQIQQITPAQLAALDLTHCQWLSASQTAALSSAQVSAMSPQQIAAIPRLDSLSLAAVAVLTPAQTGALTILMKAFSADWVNALSPQAIGAIAPAVIEPLPKSAVRLLSPAAAAALTPGQILVMDYVSYLSPAAVAALTPVQAPCFVYWELERMGLNNFAAASLAAVTPSVIGKLSVATLQSLTPASVAALSGAQVAALSSPQSLSLAAVAVLTPAQTGALTQRMGGYPADWINALSPQALAAIAPAVIEPLSAAAVAALSPASAAALTPAQISVMDYVSYLSPAAVAALSPQQSACFLPWELDRMGLVNLSAASLAAIPPAVIGKLSVSTTPTLTAAAIGAMTPQQIAALPALGTLTASAIAAITPAQINALPSGLATVSADWINALSRDTVAALPASVIGTIAAAAIPGLSVATVSGMSAAQLAAVPSPDLLAPDAAAARSAVLAPVDYATVTADWVNAQSPAALAALSPTDIAKLSVATIKGLSASTVSALSPAQVNALVSPTALSLEAAAALTPAQIAAFKVWTGITATWLGALTPSACAAVPPGAIQKFTANDLKVLQPATVLKMTPAQCAALPQMAYMLSVAAAVLSPDQIRAMSPAQIGAIGKPYFLNDAAAGALSAAQMKAIYRGFENMSAGFVNALQPEALAVITPANIAKLSATAASGLNPATFAALSNDQIAAFKPVGSLSAAVIAALRPDQIALLTPISGLSAAAVAALSPAQVNALKDGLSAVNATWINALSRETLAALSPALVSTIATTAVPGLSAGTVSLLSTAQLAALPAIHTLNTAAVAALSPAQVLAVANRLSTVDAAWINALSPQALAALPAATIATLPTAAIPGLSSATVLAMSAEQLAALPSPELLSPEATVIRDAVVRPVDYAAVNAAWLNGQPAATLAAISVANIAKLSVATIQGLSADTIRALSPAQVGALSSPQSLPTAAVAALSATQVGALQNGWDSVSAGWVNALAPAALAGLSRSAMNQLTTTTVSGLTAATVSGLSAVQVASTTNLGSLKDGVKGLTADHIRALTPAQIGQLGSVHLLAPNAVSALSAAQVTSISISWKNMPAAWLNAMSPEAIAAIPAGAPGVFTTASVQGLTAAFVSAMDVQQLSMLASPQLLAPAAAAVRDARLGPWASVDWTQVTPDWINSQSPETLALMPTIKLTAALTAGLSPTTVAALSTQQIRWMSAPTSLSLEVVATLAPAQITAIATWSGCTAAWVGALSPEALKVVPTTTFNGFWYTQVQALAATTTVNMTPAQIAALRFKYYLSSSVVAGLNVDQVRALSAEDLSSLKDTRWLSVEAFSVLTSAQIQGMTSRWDGFSAAQIAAIRPDVFATVNPACTAKLNWSAVAALTTAMVSAMTIEQITTCAQIGSLSVAGTLGLRPEAIMALTAAQISTLDHPGSLPSACVAALTAEQVAAIPAGSPWDSVGNHWFDALSDSAFAGIPVERLGAQTIRNFCPELISRMSADQIAGVSNLDWIARSVAGSLRPDQLSKATDLDSVSAAWLNSLSPEAFAAIPPAGINQLSLAALQGLDATRRAIALKGADALHAGYLGMASADASLNYDSVLALLQQMAPDIGADGLSTEQFATITDLMSKSKAANGGPSYVSSLLNNMITRGVILNASADTFNAAVNKWFLGTDNPIASGYTNVDDLPLFKGSTLQGLEGVDQGGLGDCWLMAPLAALAEVSPERLNGLISANGNGTYCVKFYNKNQDDPVFITVDGKVANFGAGTGLGNWVRLIENAWVEAQSSGLISARIGTSGNNYSILKGGWDDIASRVLVGGVYKAYGSASSNYEKLAAALESNDNLVTYVSYSKKSTGADGMTNLVGSHAFAVLGIDPANGKLIFRNPWDASLVFELSAEELDAVPGTGQFSVVSIGKEYGASTVTPPAPQPMAGFATDFGSANLVQAMSMFDVPPAVTTSLPDRNTQQSQLALATVH